MPLLKGWYLLQKSTRFCIIVLCLIPLNWVWRFVSHIGEKNAGNYKKKIIIKFRSSLRQISSLEMLHLFFCSVSYVVYTERKPSESEH